MRLFFSLTLLFCLTLHAAPSMAAVLPGIDVLASRRFDTLRGKRVGLITNHTGRNTKGTSTIDILYQAPDVRLTALFSPEHGIRGKSDVKLDSGVDSRTGLPIYSLYGKTCRPTPDMLKNIDVLVFDIQDIGTRFYTYIGTLSLAMRAAKAAGIPFVVLDRPNPINGVTVAGAIPDKLPPERKSGCGAITCIHPIPTRHGMTVGELARLFNSEFGIGCRLSVVPMLGWQRHMYLDETGLEWINPSPNMKSLDAALLYPGPGTLETTSLSVARGTAEPFEMYGAPWVNADAVLKNLQARQLTGITFQTCSFVPTAPGHPHKGKTCYGIRITSIDRAKIDPILMGMHMAQAFYQTHPQQFKRYEGFKTEVGDSEVWDLLTVKAGKPGEIVEQWRSELEEFGKIRQKYLLY